MSPLADTEFTWKNTSSRNRKGKWEFILVTGLPQVKRSIALSSYDAAEECFGALSFDGIHLCLGFLYSSMLLQYVNLLPSVLKIFSILLAKVLKYMQRLTSFQGKVEAFQRNVLNTIFPILSSSSP